MSIDQEPAATFTPDEFGVPPLPRADAPELEWDVWKMGVRLASNIKLVASVSHATISSDYLLHWNPETGRIEVFNRSPDRT